MEVVRRRSGPGAVDGTGDVTRAERNGEGEGERELGGRSSGRSENEDGAGRVPVGEFVYGRGEAMGAGRKLKYRAWKEGGARE